LQQSKELFAVSTGRWSLWPIIKGGLFAKLCWRIVKKHRRRTVFQQKTVILRKAKEFALGCFEWHFCLKSFKNQKKERPVIMAFAHSGDRYKSEDGRYKHSFYDNIYESGTKTFDMFIVEKTNGKKRLKNTVGPRHLRGEYFDFSGSIGARFFKPNPQIQDKIVQLSEIIISLLGGYPDIQSVVTDELASGLAAQRLYYFNQMKKRADAVIEKIRPSVILVTDSPSYYAVIAAAKEKNIPAIEIQHGDFSPIYPPFCWPAWAKDIKNRLPIPDKIITFGKYWGDKLVEGGFWTPDEVAPLGKARLDEFRRKNHGNNSNARKRNKSDSIKLLFTTQDTTREKTIPFFEKVLQIASTKSIPLILYIKVHQFEENYVHLYKVLQNKYPDKCIVCHPNKKLLYDLMLETDIHLSVYSTSLYESIAIGTPTGVLDFDGREGIVVLLRNNNVRLFAYPEDLIQGVREAMDWSDWWQEWIKSTKKAKDYFFTSGAIESHVNYLNNILLSESRLL